MQRPVLWYVHHHGTGHWRRALAVAAQLAGPVRFVSSAPPPWPLPPNATFTRLAPDAPADEPGDPTANGRFHWAPERHPGLLARHAQLLESARGCGVAVVDVSVEVGLLLRVSGVPIIAVRLPGARGDAPHELLHGVAQQVVMPVPANWALGGTPVGLVAGVSGEFPETPPDGSVLVVRGGGGSAMTDAGVACLVRAVGADRVVVAASDIGPLLSAASVVVGGTGLGTVADVARAGRPFLGLPDVRPFGEQEATGCCLARHEAAYIAARLPADEAAWCAALASAIAEGPLRADTGGARRFADLVMAAS